MNVATAARKNDYTRIAVRWKTPIIKKIRIISQENTVFSVCNCKNIIITMSCQL